MGTMLVFGTAKICIFYAIAIENITFLLNLLRFIKSDGLMRREIKLSLAYRDMWQSAWNRFPTADQLVRVAPAIVGMGCFDRVETNGGAFEQVSLISGENPNRTVREWTAPFRKAGIRTQMLERGLSALRMNPVPADVRELMFKVKKAQGVDIARSFCGLNDHRNLRLSIEYARSAGMISQVALCLADSPVHTLEGHLRFLDRVVEYGCDEICLKDMAGTARPSFLAGMTSSIRKRYPHIHIQYHAHCGPQPQTESILEVVRAGVDCVDVAIGPLTRGKSHPDLLAVRKILKDDGFIVRDVDMDAYMDAVALTREFMNGASQDSAIGSDADILRILANSILPGGMTGSMMAELKDYISALNASLKSQGKPEITISRLMDMLLEEIDYVWPRLGYPPLVTPFSQYVKNTALMNIMNMMNGRPRWTTIDQDTWRMILGKMGRLPGELSSELRNIAVSRGKEFHYGNPQDAYPDELDRFRKIMDEEGWEYGRDDEELLELAMHERQYRIFKSSLDRNV